MTDGGLAANLERVLPEEVAVRIDRSTWTPAPVFTLVREVGRVTEAELEGTLNLGVGMVAVVDADDVARVLATLEQHAVPSWVCGEAALVGGADRGPASVVLNGAHPGW